MEAPAATNTAAVKLRHLVVWIRYSVFHASQKYPMGQHSTMDPPTRAAVVPATKMIKAYVILLKRRPGKIRKYKNKMEIFVSPTCSR